MDANPLLKELHLHIDHAALQPETDEAAIRKLCDEALQFRFHAVAVNPVWVSIARDHLAGSGVKVVSVAGFPLGANRTDIKVAEAIECVNDGAYEIDMVANIGWLCSERFSDVEGEIRKVRRNLPPEVILKVIVEANKLSPDQQIAATKAVLDAGAQYIKTGTGFFGAAAVDQVERMHQASAGFIAVKASGGIRTIEDCRAMLAAGATRLGSSSSVAIMRQLEQANKDSRQA